ncbi:MAG: hypothetical protein ABSF53_25125 [Terracidiphilus sp.]
MSRKTVTFRSQTMGSISDLIRDEGLVCQESQSMLSFLAGELILYLDEGVDLSPTVLFCTDAAAVFSGIPVSTGHIIGTAPLHANAIKRVLKECAPLAKGSWNVYIERTSAFNCNYGVFSYVASPTTIPLPEAIGVTSAGTCLMIRKVGPNTIEVKGSKGNELLLGFSTTKEEETQHINPVKGFAAACCGDLPPGAFADEFRTYFKRLLEEGLGRSHGAILACASSPSLKDIGDLEDGIEIAPQLDFFVPYRDYRVDNTAESILRLQSAEGLFSGILQADGIIMFDTRGRLVAYRIFYRSSQRAETKASASLAAPAVGHSRGSNRWWGDR